jgi:hypothetical protein
VQKKHDAEFLEAGEDTPKSFEPKEQALDFVAAAAHCIARSYSQAAIRLRLGGVKFRPILSRFVAGLYSVQRVFYGQ